MREQWVGIDFGDEFAVAVDEDGYPAVRIENRVWAGDEDRWITVGSVGRDKEEDVRALAQTLVELADRMAAERNATQKRLAG